MKSYCFQAISPQVLAHYSGLYFKHERLGACNQQNPWSWQRSYAFWYILAETEEEELAKRDCKSHSISIVLRYQVPYLNTTQYIHKKCNWKSNRVRNVVDWFVSSVGGGALPVVPNVLSIKQHGGRTGHVYTQDNRTVVQIGCSTRKILSHPNG